MQLSQTQFLWFLLSMTGVITLAVVLLSKIMRRHNAQKPDAMKTLRMLLHNDHQVRIQKDSTEKKKILTTN